jgi:hypothetical protein
MDPKNINKMRQEEEGGGKGHQTLDIVSAGDH